MQTKIRCKSCHFTGEIEFGNDGFDQTFPYCPECASEDVIDLKEYVPYSRRSLIENAFFLSEVFDYLERDLGCDISHEEDSEVGAVSIHGLYDNLGITSLYFSDGEVMITFVDWVRMPIDIFLKTYKTLLPAIRDERNK